MHCIEYLLLVVECHSKCHRDSGCSRRGAGKCDSRCVKGYILKSNKCISMLSFVSWFHCIFLWAFKFVFNLTWCFIGFRTYSGSDWNWVSCWSTKQWILAAHNTSRPAVASQAYKIFALTATQLLSVPWNSLSVSASAFQYRPGTCN